MYLQIYNHIDSENIFNHISNDCIICLEKCEKKISKRTTIASHYKKECQCEYYAHKECYEQWFDKCLRCPICRESLAYINETNNVSFVYLFVKWIFIIFYAISLKFFIYLITRSVVVVVFKKNHNLLHEL